MDTIYKKGDLHPIKDRIFWSYTHRDKTIAKEQWLSPKAYKNKEIARVKFQKSNLYKEKCKKDYLRKKDYIAERDKNRKEVYKTHNPFRLMISSLKLSAKRRKLSFELKYEDLQNLWNNQKGKCYYTNLDMNFTYSLSLPKQMSVDRKNSTIGYTLDNCVLCCQFINYAKHDYKMEDFLEFLKELRN